MKQPTRADPEQKYRILYEFTSDAVMLLNEQNFFDCNPATLKMFGCATREQFLGKHPSEFSPEFQPGGQTSASLSQQRITTALREGMCRFEWQHCRLDGSEFPAEVWLTAMDIGGEKVLQAVVRDITERKQAEEELREREERYRTILETIQDGYYEVDIAGNLTFFNDSLCRLYGYSEDELMGMNYRQYMDDETAKAVYQNYNTVYRTGKPTEAFGCGIIRKDGTGRFVQVSVSLRRGPTGEPVGFRGIARDVTERQRVEEESHAVRQQLLDIIDFLPDATFVIDQDKKVIAWNRAAEEMTGTRKEDILGQGDYAYAVPFYGERRPVLIDLIEMEDSEFRSRYPSIQKKGNTLYTEVFVPHVYGGRGAVLWATASPLLDSKGNKVGAIESLRDVTERQRVEEESRATRQQLSDIIDFLPDATFVIDQDRRVIAWNRAAEEMTGTRKEDILGQGDYAYALPFWEDRRPMLIDFIWTEDPEFMSKYPSIQKKGATFYTEVFVPHVYGGRGAVLWATASPLLDSEGNRVGAIESVRDITERKRAEEESQAARQQLLDIIDFSPDATFVIDQDKKVIAWNRAAEEMTGTRKEDILGQGDYAYAVPWWGERRPMVVDLIGMEDSEFRAKYDFVQKIGGNTLYAEVFVPRIFGGRGGYLAATAAPLLDSAGNMVGAIESVRDITDRKKLERQIQESLARRGDQVQTSTEVAQEIAAAPALDELFRRVVMLVKERFGYYHTQIFRYEPSLNAVVLVSGYGEVGQKMLAAGHRLAMGRGVVGTAAATRRPILVTDVTQDKEWQPNPNLPETKGELAVPIKLRDQILGILDVQSDRAGALTQDDQLVLEGLCGQIAIAIEDTRLRQEMEERLRELNAMYRATSREGWETFRQAADSPTGYLFDRTVIQPAEDLWTPEIAKAVEQSALVSPASSRVAVSKAQESSNASAAVAPLSVRGEVVGALGVYDDPQRPMSSDDLALVEAFSEQVALALDSARLYEQTQASLSEARTRAEELAALNELAQTLSTRLNVGQVLQETYRGLSRLMDATNFFIALYDPEKNEVSFPINVSESVLDQQITVMPADQGMTGHIIRNRTSVLIKEDMHAWHERMGMETVGEIALSWLGVPLMTGDQITGVMAVQSYTTPGLYDEHDRDLLSAFASQTAIAIQNARLFEQTQTRVRQLAVLNEISRATSGVLETDLLLGVTYNQVQLAMKTDVFYVGLYDPDQRLVTFPIFYDEGQRYEEPASPLLPDSLTGQVILSGLPLLRRAPERREQKLKLPPGSRLSDLNRVQASLIFAPLKIGERVLGVISVQSYEPDAYAQEHLDLLTGIANQVVVALENARLFEEARVRAEEMRKSEEKYRTILENIQDVYFEVDSAGNFTFFNDALCRLLGYPRDELLGMNNRGYMDDENAKAVYRVFSEVYRTKRPAQAFNYEVIRKDGSRRSVEVSTSLITDSMGEPIGFRGVMRDVTERKRAEETLERRAMQLQTAAEVSRAASSILTVDELLPQVVSLVRERFDLYYVGLFLVDETGEWAVLQSGSGEAGRKMIGVGHKLQVGSESMIGGCVASQQARIALDVGQDAVHFGNPLLPETRSELALPLITRGQTIGAMTIQSSQPAAFTQEDVTVFQTMADELANAIQNARLFEETRVRAEEMTVLNELSQSLTTRLDVEGVLDEAYRGAVRLLATDSFNIALYDPDKNEVTFALDVASGQVRRHYATRQAGRGMTEYILRHRAPLLIKENLPERIAELGIEHVGQGTLSWLGVPLISGDRALGVMAVRSYTIPRAFNERDQERLVAIASQTAIALQNAYLFEQTQTRVRQLAVLNEISRATSGVLETDLLLGVIYSQIQLAMKTDVFYVGLYDPDQRLVTFPIFYDENQRYEEPASPLLPDSLTGQVILSGLPLLRRAPERREQKLKLPPGSRLSDLNRVQASLIFAPLKIGERVLGVISVQSYEPDAYAQEHLDLLTGIANQVVVALENARLFEEVRVRAEEMAVLNQVAQTLSTRLNVDQVLQETYRGLSRLMDTTNFYVGLYDPEKNEVSFPINVSESILDQQSTVMPADQGMTGYIIRNHTPVLIKDNVGEWNKRMGIEMVGEIALSWLGVPLMIGDQMLGVMAVQSYTTPGMYDEHDRDLLTTFAGQTAIAIQNARLFEQTRAALAEVEATHRRYLREQWETFAYSRAGAAERILGYADGPDGLIPAGDESLAVAPAARAGSLRVPIKLRDESIGVLEFLDKDTARAWSEDEITLVEALADQAGLALENARLFEQTQRLAGRERLINEITARIRAATGVPGILQTAARELATAMNVPHAVARIRVRAEDSGLEIEDKTA